MDPPRDARGRAAWKGTESRRQDAFWWVAGIGLLSGLLHLIVKDAQLDIREATGDSSLFVNTARYVLATAGGFALYVLVLALCAAGRLRSRGTQVLALAWPLAFNILFLIGSPSFSTDVLLYISQGYIGGPMGGNPYLQPGASVAGTSLGMQLATYGWTPKPVSPYGPLWTAVEAIAVSMADNIATQILVLKAVAIAASLASAVLIWRILACSRPERRLLGTLAFLWNPMVIVEFAGEGHNDAVMILFVLLAVALALRRQEPWALVALCGGVLTKFVPLVFLPVVVAWSCRTSSDQIQTVKRLAAGLGGAALLALVTFRPWWSGLATLDGLRLAGRPGQHGSTPTLVLEALTRTTDLLPSLSMSLVMLAATVVLAVVVAWAAWSATNAETFLRGEAAVAVAFLLAASPKYWPWYATLPVALLVLPPGRLPVALLVTLSLGSRLAAPLETFWEHSAISHFWFLLGTWLLGIGAPLAVVAIAAVFSSRWRGSTPCASALLHE